MLATTVTRPSPAHSLPTEETGHRTSCPPRPRPSAVARRLRICAAVNTTDPDSIRCHWESIRIDNSASSQYSILATPPRTRPQAATSISGSVPGLCGIGGSPSKTSVHVRSGGHSFGPGYGGMIPMTSSLRILSQSHREPSRSQPPAVALPNTSTTPKAWLTASELMPVSRPLVTGVVDASRQGWPVVSCFSHPVFVPFPFPSPLLPLDACRLGMHAH